MFETHICPIYADANSKTKVRASRFFFKKQHSVSETRVDHVNQHWGDWKF